MFFAFFFKEFNLIDKVHKKMSCFPGSVTVHLKKMGIFDKFEPCHEILNNVTLVTSKALIRLHLSAV